jgi:hypothetical protein
VEDFGGFLAGEVFDHLCENVAIIGNELKVKNLRGSALAVSIAARAGRGGPVLPVFRVLPRIGSARTSWRFGLRGDHGIFAHGGDAAFVSSRKNSQIATSW